MPFGCSARAHGPGRTVRETGPLGSVELPGFSRGEGLFLGLAAVTIGFWGSFGVDFDAARGSGSGTEAESTIAAIAGDPGQVMRAAGGGPERGRLLFEENGCSSCHLLDGQRGIGPNLRGIWGSRQALADGSSVVVDRRYFEESVLHPEARLVRGYQPAMPSYEGLLSPGDLEAFADYISSLK